MNVRGTPQKKRIGELLVAQGVVEPWQVQEALEEQKKSGGKIVQILVAKGYLTADDFQHFLAKQPGIASIELQNYMVQDSLLRLIPPEFAVAHEVFPLDRLGSLLTVGMVCPLDSKTITEIEQMTKLRVRALLCNPEDIRAMIAKNYGEALEQVQQPEEGSRAEELGAISVSIRLGCVADLVRKIDTLPSLPSTVRRLQQAIANPEISVQEIVAIVGRDPLVAAKMLRVVNSAAFGFVRRVESIHRAVTLLGLKETYLIVLSSAVPDLFAHSRHFDYQRFWRDSVKCAIVCAALAEAAHIRRTASYFTAGLLHAIGKAALAQAAPERYAKVDVSLCGQALLDSEEKELGLTHPEAGYVLAENWGFPPELCEPIRYHHHPERAEQAKQIVAFVAAASDLSEAMRVGSAAQWFRDHADQMAALGVKDADFDRIAERMEAAAALHP